MADPKNGRVSVVGPDGKRYSVPADQVSRAMARGYLPADSQTGQPDRSMVEKVWNRLNTGFVSPDQALGVITLGRQGEKTPETVEALRKASAAPPKRSQLGEPYGKTFERSFTQGLRASEGEMLSSLTSPFALATAGLASAAKGVGPLSKVAKTLLTLQGLGFGAKGAVDVAQGIEEGITTPSGSERALTGGAQILGSAPAIAELGRGTAGAIGKFMPALLAREERAFIGSLRPPAKEIPATREAYQRVKADLQQAGIKDFGELRNFSEQQRQAAAAEVLGQLGRRSPTAGTIVATDVADAVRQRITPWMKVRTSLGGNLPAEARFINDQADAIEQNLINHPLTILEAEKIVQDINAEMAKFNKLPPEARYQAVRAGHPEAVMSAVKDELQAQIDHKLAGYKHLKARYGAYKEIQSQTERRIDQLDKESGVAHWTQRRAAEGLGGALGAIFSGDFLRGVGNILAGRTAGDMAIESIHRPERLLQRSFLPPRQTIPFGGQIIQPVASGMQQSSDDVDKALDQVFGPRQ